MKKLISLCLLSGMLLTAFAGCQTKPEASVAESTVTTSVEESSSEAEEVPEQESSVADASTEGDVYEFTDSAGRVVEISRSIERIAPSGPMAQLVLHTVAPDKLVGLATAFSEEQKQFVGTQFDSLPELGNLYADTLNMESLLLADPQLIIDIGEPKKTVVEDMDAIQEKTGIPTIFVQMDMKSIAEAYRTLGKVLGLETEAEALAVYAEKTMAEVEEKSKSIPEADRRTVLYTLEDGTSVMVADTVHTEVIDYAGGSNVAQIESNLRGGGSEVSMEQIVLWNPDVVLCLENGMYDTLGENPEWAGITAVTQGAYYEIPEYPYNWMGRPPSANRLIGTKWLGNLLYPEVFAYDMVAETQEFYQLFYHAELTEEQVKELLANSTYKQPAA